MSPLSLEKWGRSGERWSQKTHSCSRQRPTYEPSPIAMKITANPVFLDVSPNKHSHSHRNKVHRVHSHRSVALVSLCHA